MKPSELTKREYFAVMALQGILASGYKDKINAGYDCINEALQLANDLIDTIDEFEKEDRISRNKQWEWEVKLSRIQSNNQ